MWSRCAGTLGRVRMSWPVSKKRLGRRARRRFMLRTSARSLSLNTYGTWCARAAFTKTNICSAHRLRGPCWRRSRSRWRSKPAATPWREWSIRSREDALDYAAKHDVPVSQSTKKIYSRDRNIWHISHEGGALEDPANAAPDEIWMLTASPKDAPDKPAEVCIGFESGVPVSVDGQRLSGAALVEKLNKLGGEHGIGRIDLVENRFVGMKSRGCYETPGGTLIMA